MIEEDLFALILMTGSRLLRATELVRENNILGRFIFEKEKLLIFMKEFDIAFSNFDLKY